MEEEHGIVFIHVREGRRDQRVKGHKPRKVPIHSGLIRRGLLEWVSCLRRAGQERLFSEFTPGRDGYGQSCSKWYNRTFKAAHAISKDFHSYRHTLQSAYEVAGVPERVINAILGHGAGKSMSMTTYEHGLPLPNLRDAINKLPTNPGRKE